MIHFNILQPAPPPGFPWDKVVELVPQLLWPGIALALLFGVIRIEGLRKAFASLTKISVGGLELEFAAQIEEATTARNLAVDPATSRQIADRMKRLAPRLAATRLLWIDDEPDGNRRELRILKDAGVSIDMAKTDAEARLHLHGSVYDIVLSDMRREGHAERGKTFLPEILAAVLKPEVVFYVMQTRDTPAGAFGLTNRPDMLFNLILDILDRKS